MILYSAKTASIVLRNQYGMKMNLTLFFLLIINVLVGATMTIILGIQQIIGIVRMEKERRSPMIKYCVRLNDDKEECPYFKSNGITSVCRRYDSSLCYMTDYQEAKEDLKIDEENRQSNN